MDSSIDKAREEFLSEAQELVETLSRTLLMLDEQEPSGNADPGLLNEAFRAVHTLKSLAGIFGAQAMNQMSHRLEDTLDQLRLGKLVLQRDVLDALFQGVELYWQLLASERQASDVGRYGPGFSKLDPGGELLEIEGFLARLARLTPASPASKTPLGFDLDAALLAVLTEYEEHRLRSCVEQGTNLYRVRVRFNLFTIDQELEAIKQQVSPFGEVITYLPAGEAVGTDTIELDLLLASGAGLTELVAVLEAPNVTIKEVPRRRSNPRELATLPPSAPMPDFTSMDLGVPVLPQERDSIVPAAAIRSISQSVRVDIRKLDLLMSSVGELSLFKSVLNSLSERVRIEGQRRLAGELQRLVRGFERRLGELQAGILEVRMVPLSQVFDRLTRVVRQISRETGKEVRLVITGGETEIDKLIVEELSDPLVHIVRNAIDHGIEAAAQRLERDKPVAGTIALNAFQKGNRVVLEIEDDGSGIDESALIRRALALSHLTEAEAQGLSRAEALGLVFLPGLSTREIAGDVSGRGVGMDVVKTNIAKLGGVVDLDSEASVGTKITVTLPITLAIVSALLVRVNECVFAVPLAGVSEALVLDEAALGRIDHKEVMTLRGASLALCRLSELFQLPKVSDESTDKNVSKKPGKPFVIVTTLGARRLGLVVDELLGQRDLVIKTLGPSLASVRGFSGAADLGDQRVALVLDVAAIIEEVLAGAEHRDIREHGRV